MGDSSLLLCPLFVECCEFPLFEKAGSFERVLLHCDFAGRFPLEWAITSSHKVRSPDDMQFAFSYYYYMLGATTPVDVAQVFEEMDTDHSG